MAIVTLPFNFAPREYQIPFMRAFDEGCTWAILVWHRRTGKDKTCLNVVAKEMMKRVGAYYYFFPTLVQGRAALWDGIDNDGFKLMDHFPPEIVKNVNKAEMKIELVNGSIFRILGADEFDGKMGTNPIMIVFSEYSLTNPRVYGYFAPIIAANGGKIIFNFTPRGENHAYDMYRLGLSSPECFVQVIKADESKVLTKEVLERERLRILTLNGDDALFWQEYFCSFKVPIAGAYYASHIQKAYEDGRIGKVPHDPRYPVSTAWDIGRTDSNAIWYYQKVAHEIRLIRYQETTGIGIHEIAPIVLETGKKENYVFNKNFGPHDLAQGEWGSAQNSRRDTAKNLGIDFELVAKLSIMDGIDAVRAIFSRCWFDEENCKDGINGLKNYTKKYEEEKKCFLKEPLHNWASHPADAFRYLAVAIDDTAGRKIEERKRERGLSSLNFNPETC